MTPPFLPFGNAAMGNASPEAPLGQAGKEGAPADGDPLVGGAGAPSTFKRSETMNADILPFQPRDEWSEADYCSEPGAKALKEKIEAYWRERGHAVMVVLTDAGFHPSIRASRFDLRSDLVNGMPRTRPPAEAA